MIYKGELRFNCCMSTLILIDKQHPLDGFGKPVIRIASNFGGGVSDWGDICGAASGAAMAIGLIYGADGEEDLKTYEDKRAREKAITLEFLRSFTDKWGRIDCRGLLGCEGCTPEARFKWYEELKAKGETHCDEYVEWSTEKVLTIINKQSTLK